MKAYSIFSWIVRLVLRNFLRVMTLITTIMVALSLYYVVDNVLLNARVTCDSKSNKVTLTDSAQSEIMNLHLAANSRKGGAVKVLLSAYYRTGSTLTGELFAANRDSFYLYEISRPTHLTWYEAQARIGDEVDLVERRSDENEKDALYYPAIVEPIFNILQCNIESVPPMFLINSLWAKKLFNSPIKRFMECGKLLPHCNPINYDNNCKPNAHRNRELLGKCYEATFSENIDTLQPTLWNSSTWENIVKPSIKKFHKCHKDRQSQIKKCSHILHEDCLQAPVRSIKEIRLDFRLVGLLLQLDPEIKIIHLVRDPRGILASTLDIKATVIMCKRLLTDIRAFELVVNKYPGCCIQIRYEDLTTDPSKTAKRVYDHLGLDFQTYYKDWLLKINNPIHNNSSMGTFRQNMTAEAYDWKIKLPSIYSKYILNKENCGEVIRLLGYENV